MLDALLHIVELLISPPASPILAILFGVWLARHSARWGSIVGVIGLSLLILSSMPIVAFKLIHSL